MTLNELMLIPYERNARGPATLDCWGMVRLARKHLFGKELLPEFLGVSSGDVRSMTREVLRTAKKSGFKPCPAKPGAIATAWQGSTCPHVGLVIEVDGRLKVLDTNIGVGPWIHTLAGFSSKFNRVIFYDN